MFWWCHFVHSSVPFSCCWRFGLECMRYNSNSDLNTTALKISTFSLFHVLVIGTYINYPHLTTETHLPHLLLSGVSHPWPAGRMHPRMAMNAAQHKIINLLKTFLFFCSSVFLVFVYLMCGPRHIFFQCGPEMPKCWTPLYLLHTFPIFYTLIHTPTHTHTAYLILTPSLSLSFHASITEYHRLKGL